MQNLLEIALRFIAEYTLVFYGLGILGLLFYLNRARLAHRQMRMTPFPIEREEANANVRDALVIAVIFGAILGATVYIDQVLLAPDTDEGGFQFPIVFDGSIGENGEEGGDDRNSAGGGRTATPTAEPTATSPAIGPTPEMSPTPSQTPEATNTVEVPPTDTAAPTPPLPPSPETEVIATQSAQQPPTGPPPPTEPPLPSPTEALPSPTTAPSPIPTQPPQPTTPPVPGASCPTTGVQIASPGNGAAVSGTVNVSGTASIPDFQFYKVEYSQGTSLNGFASIGDIIAAPVNGGWLTSWNTSGFPKGIYALRLTVVDVTGNFPAPCTVFVILQ